MNVYASYDANRRRETWEDILRLKRSFNRGDWCLGGDFNSVTCKEERVGRGLGCRVRDMKDFKAFIEEADLVDMPCVGVKITWYNSNGDSMSRLDIFLLSENIIQNWKIVNQHIEKRDISEPLSYMDKRRGR